MEDVDDFTAALLASLTRPICMECAAERDPSWACVFYLVPPVCTHGGDS